MHCCVCKTPKRVNSQSEMDQKIDANSMKWNSTTDILSVSNIRVDFKIFECLRQQHTEPEFVCFTCHDILETVDSLQVMKLTY